MIRDYMLNTNISFDNVDFLDAQLIDNIIFDSSHYGSYATHKYNYPFSNDQIVINEEKYIAKNVGIFTFNLEKINI